MNLKKAIIFFMFIVTTNSVSVLLSENITQMLERCKEPISALEPPLPLSTLCRTPGDRGKYDLLCNGFYSILVDICTTSSSITLVQVKNSGKFDDNPETFCNKTSSMNVSANGLSVNVSKNLNLMKSINNCTALCTDFGKLNPMCPFIVSFFKLKASSTVPKNNNTIVSAMSVKNEEPPKQNVSHEDSEKHMLKKAEPFSKIDDENKLTDLAVVDVEKHRDNFNSPSNDQTVEKQQMGNSNTGAGIPANNNPGGSEGSHKGDVDDETADETPGNDEKQIDSPKQLSEIDSETRSALQQAKPDFKNNIDSEPFDEAEGGNFFAYFVFISAICMFFYVAMYNKKKILALLIEGRRSNAKRRPNSAAYSKLDCTLEEAMASGPSTSSSNTLLY